MPEGEMTDWSGKSLIEVEGTFRVRPDWFRGKLCNLYELESVQVRKTRQRPGYSPAIGWGC
jgi:hypothetical protein